MLISLQNNEINKVVFEYTIIHIVLYKNKRCINLMIINVSMVKLLNITIYKNCFTFCFNFDKMIIIIQCT